MADEGDHRRRARRARCRVRASLRDQLRFIARAGAPDSLICARRSTHFEHQLMEQIDCNLLFRCFAGLGFDDVVWPLETYTHGYGDTNVRRPSCKRSVSFTEIPFLASASRTMYLIVQSFLRARVASSLTTYRGSSSVSFLIGLAGWRCCTAVTRVAPSPVPGLSCEGAIELGTSLS